MPGLPLVIFFDRGVTNECLHSLYESFREPLNLKIICMRKLCFTLVGGVLLSTLALAQDKKQESIEGNGKMVTREVAVSSFSTLKASGVYELKLSQGDKESVRIEADENLQEYFSVKNDGNKLVIDMDKLKKKNLKTKSKMKVYVSFKKLTEMELKTVGNVASEEKLSFDDLELKNKSVGNVNLQLTAKKLEVNNSSVGNIKLSGNAQDAVVKNTGVGSFEAGGFVVQTMNIENTGVGHAEVNAEKNLTVKDSFLGKVKNKGAAVVRKTNKVRV